MTEVQDRPGKKCKKEIYEIRRHYKLLKTETPRDKTFAETQGFAGEKVNG